MDKYLQPPDQEQYTKVLKQKEDKLIKIRKDKVISTIGSLLPLKFNLLTKRIENNGTPIDGDFLTTLHLQLAEQYKLYISRDLAADAALIISRRNSYHPVKEYLESINESLREEKWSSIATCCFGVTSPMANLHLQRQLIALVARAFIPGCDLHTALVLQSDKQGIGKSKFWKILGGKWFSDSLGDLRNLKEDTLQLHSAWIHEWGEIDRVLGVRMSETLKGFLSRSWDDVRKPYGRGYEQLMRSCGIVGTTNRRDFIKDFTGNRRFPIITIEAVGLEWIEENRDLIWGSAVKAYKANTRWHYNEEENSAITLKAQEYSAPDPLREQLETWLEDNPDLKEIPVAYALNGMGLIEEMRDKQICRAMARYLQSMGWTKTPTRQRYILPNQTRTDKTSGWIKPN